MDNEPSKKDYAIVFIIGLSLLIGCGLMLWINWDSTTILGGIGRGFAGLLEFVGGIITFIGFAKGRSLYILSKKNGEDKFAFWHKDSPNDIMNDTKSRKNNNR